MQGYIVAAIGLYYKTHKNDKEVIAKLQSLAELYPARGFEDYYGKIRNEGIVWNRKRVLRIYRAIAWLKKKE